MDKLLLSQEEGRTPGYHFLLDNTWPGRRSVQRDTPDILLDMLLYTQVGVRLLYVCIDWRESFVLLFYLLLLSKILKPIKPRMRHHCTVHSYNYVFLSPVLARYRLRRYSNQI